MTLALRSPLAVLVAYLVLAAVAFAIARAARRGEPRARAAAAALRRLPPRGRAAVAVALAGLAAVGWTYASTPPAPPDRLTVRFLDVGQGDATLIQDGAGANVLFDGGPPEGRVYRSLRAAGVRQLDLVVATHQSRDHQGGLHEAIARIPTRFMLENADGTHDPDYLQLLREADARGIRHVPAQAGQVFHVGRLTIRILWPTPHVPGAPPPDDPNTRAVVAIVTEGSFDLFLSADAESPSLLDLDLPPVEAMKVPHHGSADPGLPEVLKRLAPQVAAIECGAHNLYGHPTQQTLTALHATVPHVYRTDQDGTVSVSVGDGGTLAVAKER